MAKTVIDKDQLRRAVDSIDPKRVVVSYDQDSDTLMVHFFGRGVPGVSVPAKDDPTGDWMLRVSRETGEPIGLQVEHVFSRTLGRHPRLSEILAFADVRVRPTDAVDANRQDVLAAIRELASEYALISTAAD
jgi:hypothetical protein